MGSTRPSFLRFSLVRQILDFVKMNYCILLVFENMSTLILTLYISYTFFVFVFVFFPCCVNYGVSFTNDLPFSSFLYQKLIEDFSLVVILKTIHS